jgi:phosphoenolpyruvate carboxykinase (diphosphate)
MGDNILDNLFQKNSITRYSFEEVKKLLDGKIDVMPQNYAMIKNIPTSFISMNMLILILKKVR